MPDYRCTECRKVMYLMSNRRDAKLFCPTCTKSKRRQVALARA